MHAQHFLATTGGYVDDAAEALQTTNVYVSPEVGGHADLEAQLVQEIGGESIGVAVFPDEAALEATGPEIVAALAGKSAYDTIIVAVGDDVSAGSRVLESGEALRIANEADNATDTVDEALVETVQGVVAASDSAPPVAPGIDGGLIVGLGLTVALLVGAGIAVAALLRSRRTAARADRGLPEGVRASVAVLRALSPEYSRVGAAGVPLAAETGHEIAALADNVIELFARLDKRNADDQRKIAAIEYDDKLRKLTAALNRDYLLDILTHPNLWDDPTERANEVHGALSNVAAELVENIKQVNARRGLHFQVSLDGLIGGRKELQEWEREFGEADGKTAPPA